MWEARSRKLNLVLFAKRKISVPRLYEPWFWSKKYGPSPSPRPATVMWFFLFYLFQEIDIEDEENCPYDFVEVFTGTGPQADSVGRFCGKRLPGTVTSRGHKMAIKFRSDKRLNFKGFRAQYTAGQWYRKTIKLKIVKRLESWRFERYPFIGALLTRSPSSGLILETSALEFTSTNSCRMNRYALLVLCKRGWLLCYGRQCSLENSENLKLLIYVDNLVSYK